MPTEHTLEWCIEEWIILRLLFSGQFESNFVHSENRDANSIENIPVKAVKGAELYEGCKPNEVSVTITFASNVMTLLEADELAAKIVRVINETDLSFVTDLPLGFLSLEPGQDVQRENRGKVQVRRIVLPFFGKLKP